MRKTCFPMPIRGHNATAPVWCVLAAVVATFVLAGCAHLSGSDGVTVKKRAIDQAVARAGDFYRTPYTGRINLDDLWLYQLAARHRPELRNTPFYEMNPFDRHQGQAMLRLFSADYTPEGLEIQPSSPAHPPTLKGGAYSISAPHGRQIYAPRDEVLLKALYCRETGFTQNDLDILLATIDNAGGYNDTHALASLLIIQQAGCFPVGELAPHISALVENLIRTQSATELFNDLFVERVAFLYWAGAGKQVRPEWIATILEKQRENGAWGADGNESINLHQTALALLSLIYYHEKQDIQPFWGLFVAN